MAKDALEELKEVSYICDNDYELWGRETSIPGVEICSPLRLYSENPEDIIILVTAAADYVYEITRQIQEIDDFDIFYYHLLKNEFLQEISQDLFSDYDRIKSAGRLLSDYKSRQILQEIVHRRMIGCCEEFADLRVEGEQQYLFTPMFRKINSQEIVIDCGGYTGDTIEKFVRFFGNAVKRIYSFEALSQNLEKLQQRCDKLKGPDKWKGEFKLLPFAVSDKTSIITFCETPLPGGSFSPEFRSTTKFKFTNPVQTFQVESRSIDDIIPPGEKVTLIKMDIEGAEYEACVGAERTIKMHKPRLAISIYHNACDYWRICELIKEFVPEYHMAVRHHKKRHVDTVLYAWIEENE
ncbi:MAG: FkbM family methyltransferase [Clostridium sp.]|nr:FkbM family methyltransferase [Clostridium sp.]